MGGQIVVDHQGVAPLLHPVLGHGATGKGRQVLQARKTAGFGHDDRGVLQGSVFAQQLDGTDDRGALLSNQHIDAIDVLATLIDDGIQGDRTASQALITDKQLALTLADRDQGIDDLDARVQRFMDEIARHNRR